MEKKITKEAKNDFNSENIFDDFSSDKWLWKEIKDIEIEQARDVYFYIKIWNSLFRFINIILFLLIFIYFFYSYIQKKEELKEYSFLNPICFFILWETSEWIDECYPVTAYLKDQQNKLIKTEKLYSQQILDIIWNAYTMNNFINSKSILFLSNKSKDKFDPIKILEEFDNLKNKFEPLDKTRITCKNISITNDNLFTISCSFYSSDWEKIQSGNKKDIYWTSISLALSFIDFIENSKYSKFTLLSKPQTFSVSDFSWIWRYTKVTTVNFSLKYNNLDNLSL